jgi:hypothetical protein
MNKVDKFSSLKQKSENFSCSYLSLHSTAGKRRMNSKLDQTISFRPKKNAAFVISLIEWDPNLSRRFEEKFFEPRSPKSERLQWRSTEAKLRFVRRERQKIMSRLLFKKFVSYISRRSKRALLSCIQTKRSSLVTHYIQESRYFRNKFVGGLIRF